MRRILILAGAYSLSVVFLFASAGRAQDAEKATSDEVAATDAPITGDEAAVDEEVVIILKDGTAIHGKVIDHLPSGYLIESEGVSKTVPFSNVAKVVRVAEEKAEPEAAATPAAQAAPPVTPASEARPTLPPDFPKRPPKPGAGLVASGWPLFAVGFLGALTFFNLGIWWDWDRFWPGIPAFGGLALIGIILAPIGHGMNRRAKGKWYRDRKKLLEPVPNPPGPAVSLRMVTPVLFENGGGLGMAATF